MKRLLYILTLMIFLLCGVSHAQNEWQRLINAPTFGFAVNPYNPNSLIVGGLGRRIYFSTDAGKSWRQDSIEFTTASAQFTNVFIHPLDTNIIIVAGSNFGSIRRSTDGGKTWQIVFEPELGSIVLNGESMQVAPHNPEHIYFARLQPAVLYRSTDRGATWDSISTIPKANPDDTTELDPGFCTIAFRRDSSNIILGGCTSGRIYKSLDTGKTWKIAADISLSTYGDAEIPKIAFTAEDPLVGYSIVAYFFPVSLPNGAVHRTNDGGNTWQRIAFADTSLWGLGVPLFGTPDELAVGGFSVPFAPEYRVPGNSVVGTSNDGGATWARYDNKIPWSPGKEHNVWLLKYGGDSPQNQKLYMATEAGFFVRDAAPVSVAEDHPFKNLQYAASFTNQILTLQFPVFLKEPQTLYLSDIQGKIVFTKNIAAESYSIDVRIPLELSAGVYIIHFSNSAFAPQTIVLE